MKGKKQIFSRCRRKNYEPKVKSGLAVTPSQVLKMAEQGLPVSAQLQYNQLEGHSGSDWNIPIEERRGIDVGQVWQESMSAKKRLVKGARAATSDTNT